MICPHCNKEMREKSVITSVDINEDTKTEWICDGCGHRHIIVEPPRENVSVDDHVDAERRPF